MNRQLFLYSSNRLEVLIDKLAEVLEEPLSSPFSPEIIVVQSKGMERWVSLQLAQRWGICANCEFPFPNALADILFRLLVDNGEGGGLSAYERQPLGWRILKRLPELIARREFEALRRYIGAAEPFELPWVQLTSLIASVFDQYLLYRRDLIDRWERGEDDDWQAVLWRHLVKDSSQCHRARMMGRLLERLQHPGDGVRDVLPQRLSVFGISYLPPLHLEMLAALARCRPVHLFVMNPCREYWGDLVSGREREKIMRREEASGFKSAQELHLEMGNRLLASLGRQGRDFIDTIIEYDPREWSCYQEPGRGTLLRRIQSDILHLKDNGESRLSSPSGSHEPAGRGPCSVQFHSCHSPLREVEVLNDYLLALFEATPDLQPEDVLVMTPDIERYVPFIQAVFGSAEGPDKQIPFTISDRCLQGENPLAQALLAVLDVSRGRFRISDVLAVLELPAVHERFKLSEADLERITRWLEQVRIRWGIDAVHRRDLDLPDFVDNTWGAGLDRLLLGYAMPLHDDRFFLDLLPYDAVEGADGVVLGRFVEFFSRLTRWNRRLRETRNLSDWSSLLRRVTDDFLAADEERRQDLEPVRQLLDQLESWQSLSGFDGRIPFEVVRWLLEKGFERQGRRLGFLAGGVTFCAMLPMRSIPFRVICLLGMDYDAYPRRSSAVGFDLMARRPRRGDPSRRDDDRYLFLEAVLSARDYLYVSYVGQDVHDNSVLPPSVLVSELMEVIRDEYADEQPEDGTGLPVVIRHRLQAFSPAYFRKRGDLCSYSEMAYEAAREQASGAHRDARFFAEPLTDPESSRCRVSLDELCRFFANPALFLLEQRMGMRFLRQSQPLEDDEAFSLDPLERFGLRRNLFEGFLANQDRERIVRRLRAEGRLPHGVLGEVVLARESDEQRQLVEEIRPRLERVRRQAVTVELDVDGFQLSAAIDFLGRDHRLCYRLGSLRSKDLVDAWLGHLVMNAAPGARMAKTTLVMGIEKNNRWQTLRLDPVERPREHLAAWLRRYRQGLSSPLPFFPDTSFAFARKMAASADRTKALAAAHSKWSNPYQERSESEHMAYRISFADDDPLDEAFQEVALELLSPLLAVLEREA